jgi:hypothetical protein
MLQDLWAWHPPVGVWIGILGLLGVVVPLTRDLAKMGKWEKAIWTAVMFVLLGLELKSVYQDRREHDEQQAEARAEQIAQFDRIAKGIKQTIDTSERQFEETMARSDKIMGRTNEVLAGVTGGNSFAYVSPQNFSGDQFPGIVWNNGEQALVGLTLTIAHTSDPVQVWGATFFKPIFIGTIGPHDHAPIPDFLFQPRADQTGQDNYWIMLSAQNGTAQQSLYFRRNRLHPQQWAYSFQVVRQHFAEKPQKEKMLLKINNKPRKGPRQEVLLYRAWSDDLEASAEKH